jgi:hypothetical protein
MSEYRDEKLERLLRARRDAPASPDLASQIILKAQSMPQAGTISLWQTVRQIFAEFHLPKPGYVLAGALVLGITLGFSTAPDNGPTTDGGVETAQSYLAGDEGWL